MLTSLVSISRNVKPIAPFPGIGRSSAKPARIVKVALSDAFAIPQAFDGGSRSSVATGFPSRLGSEVDWASILPEGRWLTVDLPCSVGALDKLEVPPSMDAEDGAPVILKSGGPL